MTQVWDATDIGGSELLVLLALADHANDSGICWPSLPRIASRARLSERQTQRVIQKLVADGHIKINSKGDGRGHSTIYQLVVKVDTMSPIEHRKGDNMTPLKDDNVSTFSEERATSAPERVTSDAIKGDIAMSTESIQEPKKKPIKKEKAIAANAAPAEPPEWQQFVSGLCNCCYKHADISALSAKDKGLLLSEAKIIHDGGYSLEDIRLWFGREWVNDWRYGAKKNRPTPSQVRSGIPSVRAPSDETYNLAPSIPASDNRTATKTDRKRAAFANVERELQERGLLK